MFTSLRVNIEPDSIFGITTLRVSVTHGDNYFVYQQAIPKEDHIHSMLDYMWQIAKEEIERGLEEKYPLIRKDPKLK